MCFTSGCHWEGSSPSKVCGIYLRTSVTPSGHYISNHHGWKHRMCQARITKISIISSESSWQWSVEHSPNPSLHFGLNSLLSFLRCNILSFSQDYRLYWWFSDHAYQHHADLNLRFKCSCKIVTIHNISGIISKLVWDKCADKYWSPCHCGRDTDLTLMIKHRSLSFWIFISLWIPRRSFCSEMNL